MTGQWITIADFARLSGVSRQAAHKAARRALNGIAWRGNLLQVRQTALSTGGGVSGIAYEIAVRSLPEHFQKALSSVSTTLPCNRQVDVCVPAPNQSDRVQYRWTVIEAAALAAPRSPDRAEAIRDAAERHKVPVRTIQRWITDLEAAGGDMNALARKRPADAGKKRVAVSREFDTAFLKAGHPADMLPELAALVDQQVKAGWASKLQRAGFEAVRRYVVAMLQKEVTARGISLPKSAFKLSDRRIKASSNYRVVDIRANDRKTYDDAKPRIRRDNSLFAPMQQVVMDVKPLDNIVTRPDGSTTWPKMIGFLDTGTHRTFRYFVLLDRGEGVRQEHVVEAFLAMVTDPDWGFPQQLYRDNGTEFAVFDMLRDALAMVNEPGARTIINAKPYSGASKPVESKFAVLDRFVFSQIDGWAGGNRMNKKTQTVGKPPKPYGGSFDDFVKEANERLALFEQQQIKSGPFKGRSPWSIYGDHLNAGWRPVRVEPLALDAAFSKHDSRRVDRGVVSIGGTRYLHPDLPNGERIEVMLPWRRGAWPLAMLPTGPAYLTPEMMFLPGDIAGAIESGRSQQRADRRVRSLAKEAGKADLEAFHRSEVAILPTRASPAPMIDLLMSQEAESIAHARQSAAATQAAQPTELERRRARLMRETEELEQYYASRRA